ncbi:MAG: glutamate synthase central domain-containing protein, partial [Burkholderiaceae bacterium]
MGAIDKQIAAAAAHGMYQSASEKDACGVGFVAHVKGAKSHAIIQNGLKILENLDHRGAVGADELCGDGAGILIQLPDDFYREDMAKNGVNADGRVGIELPAPGEYGVGMIFLPKEHASRLACEQELERAVKAEGQVVIGWRDVPVNREMPMSPFVREKEPIIRQIFIGRGTDITVPDALERKLYVIRKTASAAIQNLGLKHSKEYYVPSMSCRTVVYKGLLLATQVGEYYLDLQNAKCVSALALVHQRFSTNTFPEWPLAHPYRYVAHNGEINTVRGNFNWMRAREGVMKSPVLGDDLKKLYPISFEGQSDTATFDNALELLTAAGYPIAHAMMMLMPEPWEQHTLMDERRRAFYEYHASMIEPWDGPAAIAFTDGRQIGATLDRNGLRPARYILTDDDLVVCASEAGVLHHIPESKIVKKWRLQPGKMFLIDLEQGRLIDDEELKSQLANSKPYRQWIDEVRIKLDDVPKAAASAAGPSQGARAPMGGSAVHEVTSVGASLLDRQQAFGYTQEDLKFLMAPMAANAEEAVGSMGNDSPLAVLSDKNKPLYNYFKQLFAQVTNPPIDSIREQIVMSLVSFIGPKPNLLDINAVNPPLRLEVSQPVLDFADMAKLRDIAAHSRGKFKSYTLDITYPVAWGREGVEAKIASLCAEAVDAIKSGHNILIVSDREMNEARVPVPALLALSSIHQHLVKAGQRCNAGLIMETGSARETHHFALLAGYGAEAVHPYLALETVIELTKHTKDIHADKAVYNFVKAVGKGLNKVMSKMGISTYMSYCGSQIFEAVGLDKPFVEKYFYGTATQVGGVGVFEIAEEAIRTHAAAYGTDPILESMLEVGGEYAWRVRGEDHMWTPDAIAKLQHATRANNAATYKEYAQIINDQSKRHLTLRGLFEFKFDPAKAISIDEVEPAKEIVKRFASGAMSLGSISTEAHTTLAVAMNRIGGKSNTGEGGEDPLRYRAEVAAARAENAKLGISADVYQGKGKRFIPVIKDGDSVGTSLGGERIVSDIPLKAGDSLRSKIKQV